MSESGTSMTPDDILAPYLSAWRLAPAGASIVTPRACLAPVTRDGEALMLKVATDPDERFGGVLLAWWNGQGAAHLIEADADAILMERATGSRSLAAEARGGRDDEAMGVLCDVVAGLHAPRGAPPSGLVPLDRWFEALWPGADSYGGLLRRSAAEARALLADPREVVPLHGDVHHDNVLDFGPRGWLAIDPKRLIGERAFDYANLFCNPDMDHPQPPVATRPDRFAHRLEIVLARSGLDRRRLLRWIVAWTGLSAAWILGDGDEPAVDLAVGALAQAALARLG
jgi:streptomycin 6-kinase